MYLHEFLLQLIGTIAIVFMLMQMGGRIYRLFDRKKDRRLRKELFATIFSLTILYGILQIFSLPISFLYFLCAAIIILLNKFWFYWAPDKIKEKSST